MTTKTVTIQTIGWKAAHDLAGAGAAAAAERGLAVCVAVLDASGIQVTFVRMNGAPLHSSDIASDKAHTAVSFGRPTGAWADILAKRSTAVAEGLKSRARFLTMKGGVPLVVGGARIGAIGVSGASEDEDEACARAGMKAVGLGDST